ncbi:MAG: phosphatidylglycerophosphatase A [Chitinispirillaceae bacterium]|jgi:phosphatidylglycerophosphatase A
MDTTLYKQWIRKACSSVCFIGYLPASGTAASALVILVLLFIKAKTGLSYGGVAYWLATLAMIGCSFYFSNHSRELFGREDSSRIVIDEVAGQMITFLLVPLTLRTLIAGFMIFRFFDIVKPFPIYHMEELEGGVGVTMDDVAAGIMANASLLVILITYHAIKGYL